MIKIRKDTTEHQLNAQKYCIDNNIEIDTTNDDTGWAVWITYPNGFDEVYSCYLLEDDMSKDYWKATAYAADYWWNHERSLMQTTIVPQVPQAPQAPSVPQAPQVPKAPSVPQAPQVPSVPQVPQVPQVPKVPEIPKVPEVPSVSNKKY